MYQQGLHEGTAPSAESHLRFSSSGFATSSLRANVVACCRTLKAKSLKAPCTRLTYIAHALHLHAAEGSRKHPGDHGMQRHRLVPGQKTWGALQTRSWELVKASEALRAEEPRRGRFLSCLVSRVSYAVFLRRITRTDKTTTNRMAAMTRIIITEFIGDGSFPAGER